MYELVNAQHIMMKPLPNTIDTACSRAWLGVIKKQKESHHITTRMATKLFYCNFCFIMMLHCISCCYRYCCSGYSCYCCYSCYSCYFTSTYKEKFDVCACKCDCICRVFVENLLMYTM